GGARLVTSTARGFLVEGDLDRDQAERLARELLVDPLVESGRVGSLNELATDDLLATVLLKPGVMDPVALSVAEAARDLEILIALVRTFRRYFGPPMEPDVRSVLFRRVLANEAIEQVVEGPLALEHLDVGRPYTMHRIVVPLRDLDDAGLEQLS